MSVYRFEFMMQGPQVLRFRLDLLLKDVNLLKNQLEECEFARKLTDFRSLLHVFMSLCRLRGVDGTFVCFHCCEMSRFPSLTS